MKFVYTEKGWCELLVDLKEEFLTDADFKFSMSEPNTQNVNTLLQPEKTFEGIKFKEGDQYEFSPDCKIKIIFYIFKKIIFSNKIYFQYRLFAKLI